MALIPAPTYSSDFRRGRQLGSLEKTTRASVATYFNKLGNLVDSSLNESRFDFDPTTLSSRGILTEPASTNILLQSQCDTGWAGAGTTPPVIANSVTFAGESCGSVTFDSSLTGGYLGSRAQRTAFGGPVVGGGTYYYWQLRIALSRPLVTGETIGVYFTGPYGLDRVAVTSAHVASLNPSRFVTVGNLGRTTPGATGAGSDYPVVYSDTTLSTPLTVYMNCGQLEQATSGTSYIRSLGTAGTRARTDLLISGTDVARIYNPNEWTILFDGTRSGNGTVSTDEGMVILGSGGSYTNSCGLAASGGGVYGFSTVGGNVLTKTFLPSDPVSPKRFRAALSYKNGRWLGAMNGSSIVVSESANLPAVDTIYIASAPSGTSWKGHTERWEMRAVALDLSELAQLTKIQ